MRHNILLNKERKKKKMIKTTIVTTFIILFAVIVKMGVSYFTTQGQITGSKTIYIAAFAPKVNDSTNISQSINLSSTITNNKNLAPGAKGRFEIDVDFSEVETDASYEISVDRSNIPNNIHLYVDETYSDELSNISGIQLINNQDKIAKHYIYWEWIYTNTPEGNTYDTNYMNKNIIIPITTTISQKVENNGIIINNYERPTGTVFLRGTEGSFTLNLDFSNITTSNYKIYFSKNDISSTIHLYSDSNYTNEITNISDYFDGNITTINKVVYWKTNSYINDYLYYILELQ